MLKITTPPTEEHLPPSLQGKKEKKILKNNSIWGNYPPLSKYATDIHETFISVGCRFSIIRSLQVRHAVNRSPLKRRKSRRLRVVALWNWALRKLSKTSRQLKLRITRTTGIVIYSDKFINVKNWHFITFPAASMHKNTYIFIPLSNFL